MFKILTTTENSTFECQQASIIVNGSYSKDVVSGKIVNIHGDCYRNNSGQAGESFGYFNGFPAVDGEISYDISQMKRSDNNLVWDAIEEIEEAILQKADGE